MFQVIRYQLEHKIAATRRHAFLVRLHALAIENYLLAYNSQRGVIFGDNDLLWQDILETPDKYSVINQLRHYSDISIHDLPKAEKYQDFFAMNKLSSFKKVSEYCPVFSGECEMDKLKKAIDKDLPNLLNELRTGNGKETCQSEQCNGKEEL